MDDLEKFRSIRQGGKTSGKVRVTDLTEKGKVRGFEVEYGDGRRQAVVNPDTVRYALSLRDD
jgi:hypothetical protein